MRQFHMMRYQKKPVTKQLHDQSRRIEDVSCSQCGRQFKQRSGAGYGHRKGASKAGMKYTPLCRSCFFKSYNEMNKTKIEMAGEKDLKKAIWLLKRAKKYQAAQVLTKQLEGLTGA